MYRLDADAVTEGFSGWVEPCLTPLTVLFVFTLLLQLHNHAKLVLRGCWQVYRLIASLKNKS